MLLRNHNFILGSLILLVFGAVNGLSTENVKVKRQMSGPMFAAGGCTPGFACGPGFAPGGCCPCGCAAPVFSPPPPPPAPIPPPPPAVPAGRLIPQVSITLIKNIILQALPGAPCEPGVECTGGSVCSMGICLCPPELVQEGTVCVSRTIYGVVPPNPPVSMYPAPPPPPPPPAYAPPPAFPPPGPAPAFFNSPCYQAPLAFAPPPPPPPAQMGCGFCGGPCVQKSKALHKFVVGGKRNV